jgi:chromosome segregation ATPase
MDQLDKKFENDAKQVDKRLDEGDKIAREKCSKIKEFESEAQEAAKQLNKEQEKHSKSEFFIAYLTYKIAFSEQAKLEEKLEVQEEKTMKMARELAAEQDEQQRIENERLQEALAKEEGKLLAVLSLITTFLQKLAVLLANLLPSVSRIVNLPKEKCTSWKRLNARQAFNF